MFPIGNKMICRITVDMIMTVLLLLLMARQLTGDLVHEWLGAGMFLLWAVHHILNRSWYGCLFKGKYAPIRIFQTAINFSLLIAMLGCMVSGVILSREVFAFLPILGGIVLARPLHIFSSFWGYVLMAWHLGLHWNMVLSMVCKADKPSVSMQTRFMSAGAVLIAGYGLYAFLKNQILSYLFLRTHFVFFDFERPVLLFFAEYIAIMGLFVFLAHYSVKWMHGLGRKRLVIKGNKRTQDEIADGADKGHKVGVFAMGTYMTLTAYGESVKTALKLSEDKIKKLEAMWSVRKEESDIYKVNHNGGKATKISGETAEALQFALDMAAQTKGALEPTIFPIITAWGFMRHDYRMPSEKDMESLLQHVGYKKVTLEKNIVTLPAGMQLDFGAIGKGYTGDIISELLKVHGVTSALLDIGGNIQMIGQKPDGSRWRVGIQNPFGEGRLGVLESEDGAVVTSGNYERYFIGEDGKRYGHIIDPYTGYPAENGLASVSIIAKEGKRCDALSTAVYVMGLEKATEYWRENGGFEMLLVTDENEIYLTKGIENDFIPDENFSGMEVYVLER